MKSAIALLLILASALYCRTNAEIKLEGFVPPGIEAGQLESEYNRIWKTISPARAQNNNIPITISYYVRSMQKEKSPLPEWGGGGALSANRIIIPMDQPPLLNLSLYQITVHELVHCALMRAYPRVSIPRWFHEGAAMTLSGELSLTEQETISRAILFSRLLALVSIDSVNGFSAFKAEVAYAQSHLAVLFLIDKYGMTIMPSVLSAASQKAGGSFWAGLDSVVSLTPQEFEIAYKNYLNDKYHFVFLLSDNYMFWIGIVCLFAVGLILTFRRNKKRRAKLALEDQQQDLNKENEVPPAGDGSPGVP